VYLVTCTTHNRRTLLANNTVHEAFKGAAAKTGQFGNAVGRYVIMPDHLHFFIRIGGDGRLMTAVKYIKEVVSKSLQGQTGGSPVWQRGFFDHLLRSCESYQEKWEYVRLNPVRAGLATNADMWPLQGEIEAIAL
jgi:REP element-mobilizing transposase RayT